MSPSSLVEQAKQGNAIAIAELITRSLQSQHIQAHAQYQGQSTLQIILEADLPPDRGQILPLVQKGMLRLSPPSIQTVQVYGQQSGQSTPDWTTEFTLPHRQPAIDPVDPINSVNQPPTESAPIDSSQANASFDASTPHAPINTSQRPAGQDSNLQRLMARNTTWAMLCHLAALLPYLVALGDTVAGGLLTLFLGSGTLMVPIAVPLLVLLIKGDDSELIRAHAKEALNFRLSMLLYWIVCLALIVLSVILIVVLIGVVMLVFLIPLAIALAIFDIVCVIMASTNANNGRLYRYPLCIRFFT